MKGLKLGAAGVALTALAMLTAAPASAANLKVHLGGIGNGKPIPTQYAFCVPSEQGHTGPGANKNPKISWSKGPKGTQSYAIIASDPDVPTIRTDMNQEGKTLAADMPRRTFYHWVLVDIPANVTAIPEAGDSDSRVIHGKPPGPAKIGVRGVNDYTAAFATNDAMKGNYGGYDGPCPPWNDLRMHHYHFTVYALDVANLSVSGNFTGPDAVAAMKGHILAQGETIGIYTQNPALTKKQASK